VVWCTEPPKLQTFGGDTTFVRRSRRLQIQWFWDNLQRKNKWPQPTALRKLTSTRAEDVVCTFLLHYTNDSFEVQKDWTLKETSTLGVKWCQCHTAMVDCLTTEGKHVSGHMWKGRLLVMDGLNLFFIMISVITYQQPFWLQLRYHRKRKEKKRKEKKRKEKKRKEKKRKGTDCTQWW
jgi:Ca2+/H+ antiporter